MCNHFIGILVRVLTKGLFFTVVHMQIRITGEVNSTNRGLQSSGIQPGVHVPLGVREDILGGM
jgi:hypothetical protein